MDENDELLECARSWIEDSFEGGAEVVYVLTPTQLVAAVNKHYVGGWDQFVADDGQYA